MSYSEQRKFDRRTLLRLAGGALGALLAGALGGCDAGEVSEPTASPTSSADNGHPGPPGSPTPGFNREGASPSPTPAGISTTKPAFSDTPPPTAMAEPTQNPEPTEAQPAVATEFVPQPEVNAHIIGERAKWFKWDEQRQGEPPRDTDGKELLVACVSDETSRVVVAGAHHAVNYAEDQNGNIVPGVVTKVFAWTNAEQEFGKEFLCHGPYVFIRADMDPAAAAKFMAEQGLYFEPTPSP